MSSLLLVSCGFVERAVVEDAGLLVLTSAPPSSRRSYFLPAYEGRSRRVRFSGFRAERPNTTLSVKDIYAHGASR